MTTPLPPGSSSGSWLDGLNRRQALCIASQSWPKYGPALPHHPVCPAWCLELWAVFPGAKFLWLAPGLSFPSSSRRCLGRFQFLGDIMLGVQYIREECKSVWFRKSPVPVGGYSGEILSWVDLGMGKLSSDMRRSP